MMSVCEEKEVWFCGKHRFKTTDHYMFILHELNWNIIASQNLQNSILNVNMFQQLFAFDAFIVNTDRGTGKNEHVIIIQTDSGCSFYAIDHGHTLNGCTRGEIKWQKENISDDDKFPLNSFNHISESYIRGFTDLEPMIKRIEEIQDGTIDNIVDETCLLVARDRPKEEQQSLELNCEIIKKLLKHRRNHLRKWLMDWCNSKGKIILNN